MKARKRGNNCKESPDCSAGDVFGEKEFVVPEVYGESVRNVLCAILSLPKGHPEGSCRAERDGTFTTEILRTAVRVECKVLRTRP